MPGQRIRGQIKNYPAIAALQIRQRVEQRRGDRGVLMQQSKIFLMSKRAMRQQIRTIGIAQRSALPGVAAEQRLHPAFFRQRGQIKVRAELAHRRAVNQQYAFAQRRQRPAERGADRGGARTAAYALQRDQRH